MIFRLDPPIPVRHTDKRKGWAHAWLDYSQDHDLIWVVCWDESLEWWCVPNSEIRGVANITLKRPHLDAGQ